jgi:hypothetical protein
MSLPDDKTPATDPQLELELLAAEKWYEAVGPTEAAAQIVAAHVALLRILGLGGLDISTATKH